MRNKFSDHRIWDRLLGDGKSVGTSFQTIRIGKSHQSMEEIAEQAFQTIRIGINHRAMDSIWTLLTSLYIED